MNLILFPTLGLSFICFWAGRKSIETLGDFKLRCVVLFLFFLFSLPGILFAVYYLHLFGEAKWFYEFRSLPYTEVAAAGAGLFAGALSAYSSESKLLASRGLILILVLGISIPYLKQIVTPLSSEYIGERWENEVCRQTTASTCGPASISTILKYYGMPATEVDIARESFTTGSGTENWYLARALRRRGFMVNYRIENGLPEDLQYPAVAGINMGSMGHFIPLLEVKDGVMIAGDPLSGRETFPLEKASERFDFTGFFMEISKIPPSLRN